MVGWGKGVVSMGESVWAGVWSFSKVPSMEDSFPLTDVMDSSMWSNLLPLITNCSECLKLTFSVMSSFDLDIVVLISAMARRR